MSKIILPRKDEDGLPYLSYSQISTWKRNKRDYIRQYFFKEKFDGNAYTDFGSLIGESLEKNNFSKFTKEEQKFLKTIPRYDEFERKIRLDFKDFYVLGYIDSNTTDLIKILDYKTGDIKKKRAEYESDDYTQLDIYAGAIYQETKVMPKSAKVVLIQRNGNAFRGEDLTLGNEFIEIERKINKTRLDKVARDIKKIAKEISEYYQVFLKLTGDEQK